MLGSWSNIPEFSRRAWGKIQKTVSLVGRFWSPRFEPGISPVIGAVDKTQDSSVGLNSLRHTSVWELKTLRVFLHIAEQQSDLVSP